MSIKKKKHQRPFFPTTITYICRLPAGDRRPIDMANMLSLIEKPIAPETGGPREKAVKRTLLKRVRQF